MFRSLSNLDQTSEVGFEKCSKFYWKHFLVRGPPYNFFVFWATTTIHTFLKSSDKTVIIRHGVLDFEFGRKKLSPQVTTDSDTVFREESIGEGFKIVTVAVFEKILLFEKKIGSSLTAIFKPIRVVTKFLVK